MDFDSQKSLISLINKLQDVFSTLGVLGKDVIELPQIVVIGAQSSGKSSVLESLVRRPFLPRGVGMVTRCPIILQLVHTPMDDREHRSVENGTLVLPEWCKFLHKPDEIFTDFDKVREEIGAEAERNAGNDKRICTKPVNLQLYSEGVVNLTVVDLPGMVQMPLAGQPLDIKDQIHNLLLSFVKNPNSIILAISPANVDIANSESLKLAKEVDPDGKRTLAVITKLDLMDKGTDAMDVLRGLVYPVKLGIIGVVNRSHQDNQNHKSIEDSLEAEINFLQKKYPSIASTNGIPYLAKTLNELLFVRITKTCLPGLKKRVDHCIRQFRRELDSCGIPINDDASKRQTLNRIIMDFSTFYNNEIDGDAGSEIETEEARGGARISYLIHEIFVKDIQGIDPMANLTDPNIFKAIRNTSGVRNALVPERTFEKLVKKQIERLEEPSMRCVRAVYSELERNIKYCGKQIQHEIIRFPGIHKGIVDVVMKLLAERLLITEKLVKDLISSQLAYINKQQQEFLLEASKLLCREEEVEKKMGDGDVGVPQVNITAALDEIFTRLFQDPSIGIEGCSSAQSSEQKLNSTNVSANRDCRIVRELVKSYFCIVRKAIQGTVPNAIMFKLVNYVQEHLQSELTCQLLKPEGMDAMLQESQYIATRRQNASTKLQVFKEANDLICQIEEISFEYW